MYFGRQVVRVRQHAAPGRGSRVRASTSTPWQIAPTGPARAPRTRRPSRCSTVAAEVLAHPRRVPARRGRSPSNAPGSMSPHAHRRAELRRRAPARGRTPSARGRAPSLPEDHAVEQPRVARAARSPPRSVANTTSWPGVAQQPPRHRDLGHVEVAVGQRHPERAVVSLRGAQRSPVRHSAWLPTGSAHPLPRRSITAIERELGVPLVIVRPHFSPPARAGGAPRG